MIIAFVANINVPFDYNCMKRVLFVMLFCVTAFFQSWGSVNDTIVLDEVIVTGSMPKVNLRYLPMSVSVVSREKIESRKDQSILPLLTEEVPGLFITQRGVMGYGVAAGAAGGMSIRGVGGTPTSGVLVLIDGHPQYMGIMGHPLADSYQSMMTERVEVVRGPASVLYGSNAMGGVINIITKQHNNDGWRNSGRVMYGSYNSLSAEVSSGWKKDKFNSTLSLGYNKSDGHRDNMDFEQYNGFAKVGYAINGNWKSFADLNLSKTMSSNPGTIKVPIIDNDADVIRGVVSAVLENEYSNTSGAIRLFYNFGKHDIDDGYKPGESPKDFRFNSKDKMFGISIYQSCSLFKGNNTTLGFDYQQFGGNAWNKFDDSNKNIDLVDITLKEYAGYLNTQQSILNNKLTVNAGVRLDHHEMSGSQWIPQLGLTYTPSLYTSFKGIVSKGFRNPTIREMYMFPPQNPDLEPESIMNYEVSLLHSFATSGVSMGLNLFLLKGNNMIQVGFVDGRPLNMNTGEINNKGFELSLNYRATQKLLMAANYSFVDMENKIVGFPEHKLYFTCSYNVDRWNLSSGLQYLGNLYTSVTDEISKNDAWLLNVRVNYKAMNCLDVFLRGENLLDRKYEINHGYPMPGITIFGGIGLNL